MKYKLALDRESCIGCGACAATYPERFELDVEKGKAKLKHSEKNRKTGFFEVEIDEKELENVKEAAEGCPVNAIHITETKTEKRII
jgi:ferredoxin